MRLGTDAVTELSWGLIHRQGMIEQCCTVAQGLRVSSTSMPRHCFWHWVQMRVSRNYTIAQRVGCEALKASEMTHAQAQAQRHEIRTIANVTIMSGWSMNELKLPQILT